MTFLALNKKSTTTQLQSTNSAFTNKNCARNTLLNARNAFLNRECVPPAVGLPRKIGIELCANHPNEGLAGFGNFEFLVAHCHKSVVVAPRPILGLLAKLLDVAAEPVGKIPP